MAHVPELMVFFAPTVNSYKRYQDASWAPTRLGWSYDNRTAGFRVVGHDQSLRIECRIPGADANPYLAYSAVLAAGLDGIANKIDPPEIFEGDVYQARELPRVPYTLRDATDLFESSDFVRDCLRRRCPGALQPLLPGRAERLRQFGHRLGALAILRADMSGRLRRQGGSDHRGRLRDRPRDLAAVRRRGGLGPGRRPQRGGRRRDGESGPRRQGEKRHAQRADVSSAEDSEAMVAAAEESFRPSRRDVQQRRDHALRRRRRGVHRREDLGPDHGHQRQGGVLRVQVRDSRAASGRWRARSSTPHRSSPCSGPPRLRWHTPLPRVRCWP